MIIKFETYNVDYTVIAKSISSGYEGRLIEHLDEKDCVTKMRWDEKGVPKEIYDHENNTWVEANNTNLKYIVTQVEDCTLIMDNIVENTFIENNSKEEIVDVITTTLEKVIREKNKVIKESRPYNSYDRFSYINSNIHFPSKEDDDDEQFRKIWLGV